MMVKRPNNSYKNTKKMLAKRLNNSPKIPKNDGKKGE
jgi:hypothetical protein